MLTKSEREHLDDKLQLVMEQLKTELVTYSLSKGRIPIDHSKIKFEAYKFRQYLDSITEKE